MTTTQLIISNTAKAIRTLITTEKLDAILCAKSDAYAAKNFNGPLTTKDLNEANQNALKEMLLEKLF